MTAEQFNKLTTLHQKNILRTLKPHDVQEYETRRGKAKAKSYLYQDFVIIVSIEAGTEIIHAFGPTSDIYQTMTQGLDDAVELEDYEAAAKIKKGLDMMSD